MTLLSVCDIWLCGSLLPAYVCGHCSGTGMVEEHKVLDVFIEQGVQNGQRIILRGEAGCTIPDLDPGDLIIEVHAKNHGTFKRKNSDLLVTQTVSLAEALCGVDVRIHHLDGRVIKLVSRPGEVIEPGQWKSIDGEGMPVHGHPLLKGNLYIKLLVAFPSHISPDKQRMWASFLEDSGTNRGSSTMEGTEFEPAAARDVRDVEEELRSRVRFGKEYRMGMDSDDDEPDMSFSHGIQCAQQ